jgi:hypothetical protein
MQLDLADSISLSIPLFQTVTYIPDGATRMTRRVRRSSAATSVVSLAAASDMRRNLKGRTCDCEAKGNLHRFTVSSLLFIHSIGKRFGSMFAAYKLIKDSNILFALLCAREKQDNSFEVQVMCVY